VATKAAPEPADRAPCKPADTGSPEPPDMAAPEPAYRAASNAADMAPPKSAARSGDEITPNPTYVTASATKAPSDSPPGAAATSAAAPDKAAATAKTAAVCSIVLTGRRRAIGSFVGEVVRIGALQSAVTRIADWKTPTPTDVPVRCACGS
jgi:hypothetical protein